LIVFDDILQKLSRNGWSAYRLAKEKQLGNGTIDRIRHGQSLSTETIDKVCELCHCQPGDIMRWEPNEKKGS